MRFTSPPATDDFTVADALFHTGPPPVPATVSFDVSWSGVVDRFSAVNQSGGSRYRGRYAQGAAVTTGWPLPGPWLSLTCAAWLAGGVFAGTGRELTSLFLTTGACHEVRTNPAFRHGPND